MTSPRFWKGPLNLLSYGVEIECVCEFKKGLFGTGHTDRKFQTALSELIGKTGYPINSDAWVTNYSTWSVVADGSLRLPETSEDKDSGTAEIVSRILWHGDYADQSAREIRGVIEAIKSEFDIYANESCGLHIHVGSFSENLKKQDFPFETLQNAAILVIAFEHVISTLLPRSRIVNPEDVHRPVEVKGLYCQPPSTQVTFEGLHIFQRLQEIHLCSNTQQLIHQMCPNGRMAAFSLDSLNSSKKTIEFRYFEGCVDPERISALVEFVTTLMTFAHSVTDPELNDIIRHVQNPNYGIFHFLLDIGITSPKVFDTLSKSLRLNPDPNPPLPPWDIRTFNLRPQPIDVKDEHEIETWEQMDQVVQADRRRRLHTTAIAWADPDNPNRIEVQNWASGVDSNNRDNGFGPFGPPPAAPFDLSNVQEVNWDDVINQTHASDPTGSGAVEGAEWPNDQRHPSLNPSMDAVYGDDSKDPPTYDEPHLSFPLDETQNLPPQSPPRVLRVMNPDEESVPSDAMGLDDGAFENENWSGWDRQSIGAGSEREGGSGHGGEEEDEPALSGRSSSVGFQDSEDGSGRSREEKDRVDLSALQRRGESAQTAESKEEGGAAYVEGQGEEEEEKAEEKDKSSKEGDFLPSEESSPAGSQDSKKSHKSRVWEERFYQSAAFQNLHEKDSGPESE